MTDVSTLSNLAAAIQTCPKQMTHGPCGGVSVAGRCEVDAARRCPYLDVLDELPWRAPKVSRDLTQARREGRLEATLRSGRFALVAEVYTPDSADLTRLVEAYLPLKDRVTALNIAEHALATPHASTLAAAALFEREGLETIINLACRDRNRIGLQGEILGAAALGVKNLFCVTGDHPKLGDQPGAKAVFDLDSLELIALAKRLRDEGELLGGRKLSAAPKLFIGGAANPFSPPVGLQAERVAAKVAAGAGFVQTQGVFDLDNFATFVDDLHAWRVLDHAYLVAGIAILTSAAQGRWLQKEVPGARVPDSLIGALDALPPGAQREAGVAYAVQLVENLKRMDGVSGALLFPLHGDIASIGEVLEKLT